MIRFGTTPIGENNTIWVGPKIENYYMHGTTPSIYKPVTKQFTLGGNGNAYGASTDTGAIGLTKQTMVSLLVRI